MDGTNHPHYLYHAADPQFVPFLREISTRKDRLRDGLRALLADPALAAETGKRAREAALARYGLHRFLADWDRLLAEVTR